jgi:hypothetical protein
MAGPGRGANMSTILSLLGIAVTAAGVAAIGFGIPINEFTLGTTLIVAGVSAFTGGLVLIGLATVVAELGRLREAMRARPIARSAAPSADAQELTQTAAAPVALATPGLMAGARAAQAASTRPKPEAPQVRPVEPRAPATSGVDTSRAEPAEPSIVADEEEVTLSPSGAALPQTHRPRTLEPAPAEPKVSAEDRVGGTAVEALKASRLDFLFRSKPARPASQRENFGAPWPAGKRAETEASQALEADQDQSDHEAAVEDRRPQQGADEQPRAAAILKSGVVDGMAYTLYADGSIEAKLPHGTVKFGSIAELRAHIENNS